VRAAVGDAVVLKGPHVAALALLRGRHRHNLLVKAPLESPALERAKSVLVELAAATSRTHVAVDVDPISMF
jgi:primosomal protein N'